MRVLWSTTFIWSQESNFDPYQCLLASPSIHERLKLLVKLIYGNELVKYLHWGIKKSTFESFGTPSKISQLECLFTVSNDKLPV